MISWETQSEKGNYGFEIQRRVESIWQKVSFIEGHDTSSIPKLYEYLDTSFIVLQPDMILYYRLKQIDIDGNGYYSDSIRVETFSLFYAPPDLYSLSKSYPNPFAAETTIECYLPETDYVSVKIFTMQGEIIRILEDRGKYAGYFRTVWDGNDEGGNPVNSGVYFYKIETSTGQIHGKKMVVLR